MSYDIYFLEAASAASVTQDNFREYFRERPHYESDALEAHYGNRFTGCHFWFSFTDQLEETEPAQNDTTDTEEIPTGFRMSGASFNLNFNRPFWFVEEAEPELQQFVDAFGLAVLDPQAETTGPYERTGFMAAWRDGNRWAVSAMSSGEWVNARTAPRERVRAAWQWNRSIPSLESRLGDDVFVPTVFWLDQPGGPVRLVTALAGAPTVIPAVERICVGRSPTGVFARLRGATEQSVVVDFETAASLLGETEIDPNAGAFRRTAFSGDLDELFRLGEGLEGVLPTVPPWQVYEAEDARTESRP